jgi:hypothetical protein
MEKDVQLMKLLMPPLLQSYRQDSTLVVVDFGWCQLVKALKAIGDVQAADGLLVEYLFTLRRERTPIPLYLSELLLRPE